MVQRGNRSIIYIWQYLLMLTVDCTVWRRLNGRVIVMVCSRACSVKKPAGWEAAGPLGRRLCGAMSWRSVRSAAGNGVPLDARLGWPEGHGELRQLVTGAVADRGLLAVCRDERCPVHEASWPGSRASCLLSWCILAVLPSRCVVDNYSFPN